MLLLGIYTISDKMTKMETHERIKLEMKYTNVHQRAGIHSTHLEQINAVWDDSYDSTRGSGLKKWGVVSNGEKKGMAAWRICRIIKDLKSLRYRIEFSAWDDEKGRPLTTEIQDNCGLTFENRLKEVGDEANNYHKRFMPCFLKNNFNNPRQSEKWQWHLVSQSKENFAHPWR